MPKLHSVLTHAQEQMRLFDGTGDALEDDIKIIHQIAGRYAHRTARLNNHEMQAIANEKMEANSHNSNVMKYNSQSLSHS